MALLGQKNQLPPKIKNPTPNQLVDIHAHIDIDTDIEIDIDISSSHFIISKMMNTYWTVNSLYLIFSPWHSGEPTMPFDF